MGNSAYSYQIKTRPGKKYYLKVVDQQSAVGNRTAKRMLFSLPLQRLIADQDLSQMTAPAPQLTIDNTLYIRQDPLLFALYECIEGETLSEAYPMSTTLVQRIGQALAELHAVQIPETLQSLSSGDMLIAPFDESLLADLASLEYISSQDAPYLQRLREIVWPQREKILAFLSHSNDYAKQAGPITTQVLCHGDPWGGNMILSSTNKLTLLDWESAVMAPPERDAFMYIGYLGPDFTAFDTGYQMVHKGPMHWNLYRLACYSYRIQLRNLSQWLHSLLHEPLKDIQRENDLNMLGFHCLDRFESVERAASKLVE